MKRIIELAQMRNDNQISTRQFRSALLAQISLITDTDLDILIEKILTEVEL